MTADSRPDPDVVRRHLARMRVVGVFVAATLPVGAVVAFFLPQFRHTLFGPTATTVLAAAAALWIGFSANRDARARLDRIKRAYAVHGSFERLFRDHLLVYLVVLLRLYMIAVCGLLVAAWGSGKLIGLSFLALAGLLMATAWPTGHKVWLLVDRARALRPGEK